MNAYWVDASAAPSDPKLMAWHARALSAGIGDGLLADVCCPLAKTERQFHILLHSGMHGFRAMLYQAMHWVGGLTEAVLL